MRVAGRDPGHGDGARVIRHLHGDEQAVDGRAATEGLHLRAVSASIGVRVPVRRFLGSFRIHSDLLWLEVTIVRWNSSGSNRCVGPDSSRLTVRHGSATPAPYFPHHPFVDVNLSGTSERGQGREGGPVVSVDRQRKRLLRFKV